MAITTEVVNDTISVPSTVSTFKCYERRRTTNTSPWGGEVLIYSKSAVNTYASKTRSRVLTRDSDWRGKIERSEVASYPYSVTVLGNEPTLVSFATGWRVRSSLLEQRYECAIPAGGLSWVSTNPDPPPPASADLKNLLITEAIAKVKSGALQSLVTLMESPKTFHMFGNTVANVASLIRTAHKRLRGNKRALNELLEWVEVHGANQGISSWLEYRYGWRILLLEIEAAMKVIFEELDLQANVLMRERTRDSAAPVGYTTYTPTSTAWGSLGFGDSANPSNTFSVNCTMKKQVQQHRGQAIIFYLLDDVAAAKHGLSLHAAPTLWELLPYSFVADWFVNIGTWLGAFATQVPGLSMKGGVYTSLVVTERVVTETRPTFAGSGPVVTAPGGSRRIRLSFKRELFNPEQTILPPVAYNGLNLLRSMDAVALVSQRLAGLSKDVTQWRFKLPRKQT